MQRHTWFALLVLAAGSGSGLQAQTVDGRFGSQCATASSLPEVRAYCGRVAEAVQVLEPRIGVALSGGNPVPGTASTLGMRLGAMPRISLGLRATAALVKVGGIESLSDEDEMTFPVPSVNVDASIGVFNGFTVGPTVGGMGSVDLLGSFGMIPLPDGEGFGSSPTSWSAGARLGILRESFVAPGISVSAMYRKLGDVEYGDPELVDEDAYFLMDDLSGWALRGAISKRLLGFGLTAGAGYDTYSSAVQIAVTDPTDLADGRFELSSEDLEASRTTFFGNASLTLLILHLVGEVGWQSGGDPDGNADIPTDHLEKSGLYGGLALRVSL